MNRWVFLCRISSSQILRRPTQKPPSSRKQVRATLLEYDYVMENVANVSDTLHDYSFFASANHGIENSSISPRRVLHQVPALTKSMSHYVKP
jgi:hypothetical protein